MIVISAICIAFNADNVVIILFVHIFIDIFMQTTSYPVGYVETWDMYPMSFLEFLTAYGINEHIIQRINQSLDQVSMIPEILHEKMNELFTTYMIIGGMPEAVKTYVETKSIKETLQVQRRIVTDYYNDMAKYAIASDKIKARECFTSIPVQLAKENKSFNIVSSKKDITPVIMTAAYSG